MALSSTTAKFTVQGDSASKVFSIPFYILDPAHVSVFFTDAAGVITQGYYVPSITIENVGFATARGIAANYIFTIDTITTTGFNITLNLALFSAVKITVYRSVPLTQLTVYTQNDLFPAKAHEAALDKIMMGLQSVALLADVALKLPIGSTVNTQLPTPSAGQVLGWNETGTALINISSPTTPLMNGVAAIGTLSTYAKGDHVHPTDTSRAAAVHTHAIADVTGLQTALDGKQAAGSYATLVGGIVPSSQLPASSFSPSTTTPLMNGVAAIGTLSTYAKGDHVHPTDTSRAAAVHVHSMSQIISLQTVLDMKQAAGSYAAAVHTHAIADVTGLQTALDGKQAAGSYAAAVHTHAIADVTGLQTALNGLVLPDIVAPYFFTQPFVGYLPQIAWDSKGRINFSGLSFYPFFNANQIYGLASVATSGSASSLTGTLAIANGGTGAATAGDAKAAMGGIQQVTVRQNANVVPATAGSLSGASWTTGSAVVTFTSSTVTLVPGMSLSASGVTSGVIKTVDSATQVTMSANATGTGGPATVTVYASTTTTLTTAAVAVFDGRTILVGDVILLTNQTAFAQNGPWVVASIGTGFNLVRPSWFTGTLAGNQLFAITNGSTFSGYLVVLFPYLISASTVAFQIGIDSLASIVVSQRNQNATLASNTFTGLQTFAANSSTGSAPFKFGGSGTGLNTTPIAHQGEWDGTLLYLTNSVGIRTIVAAFGPVPASATATGISGQFAYDGSYIYVCTATNTWRRTAIAVW
jgi:hypothetical protein